MVVELLAKDKNEIFQFEGRCKLIIDSVSKLLLIEPFIEDFKMISAMFKWKFVVQKNILFIFAEHDFQDFALIFDSPKKCNKVYGCILEKGATAGNREFIKERFLPPLLKEISINKESSSKMKGILFKWIELFDGKEKKVYIQLFKDYNINGLILSSDTENKQKQKSNNERYKNENETLSDDSGKSKTEGPIFKNTDSTRKLRKKRHSQIVEAPNFEILKYIQNGRTRTKLSIFSTSDKKYCYEYFWSESKRFFICYSCNVQKNLMTADFIKRNGNNVIKLYGVRHVCELREYKEVIEKPNFEIFSFENKGFTARRIVVFLDSSRQKCYEYARLRDVYLCCACLLMKHHTTANICQKEDGTEFIKLKLIGHVCMPRKYNPDKFSEKEIVEASKYKLFKNVRNGVDKSKLIIFASSDKTTCYEYFWFSNNKYFLCTGCNRKNKSIIAKLYSNKDGSNSVRLFKKKHVCEPIEYDPGKYEIPKENVENLNYKIFKYKHNGTETSKLIVFCSTNNNLCYEYSWNKNKQLYQCLNCTIKKHVTVTVLQDDNSKEILSFCKTQHVCKLIEFDPGKYKDDVIVNKPMYETTISSLRSIKNKVLIIYTSKEKKLYYKFNYNKRRKLYYCSQCRSHNVYITAAIQNEGKENEFVYLICQKHVCEPFQYSTLTNGNIVMAPNFQLFKTKFNSNIVQHLAIFTNDEKSECFDYTWLKDKKHFVCLPCRRDHKIYVYAKMFKTDANEECIELSEIIHKCKPTKYVRESLSEDIVKLPNFKFFETVYNKKLSKKLAIFDSKDRNMGYIYTYHGNEKKYVCDPCGKKQKYLTAKVLQDENGENYIDLNKSEHACNLQKI